LPVVIHFIKRTDICYFQLNKLLQCHIAALWNETQTLLNSYCTCWQSDIGVLAVCFHFAVALLQMRDKLVKIYDFTA